jgi:uncharacterized membrane protein YgdD (TMEM256/DUF423 family)
MVHIETELRMSKKWLIIAGISGFLGVALGAFGAHGLRNILSVEMIEIYKTGVLYQLIHSVVLLALALTAGSSFGLSKWFFLAGIILFSFSLYLYAVTGTLLFAMITPFGGVCFLAGWLSLVVIAVKKKT